MSQFKLPIRDDTVVHSSTFTVLLYDNISGVIVTDTAVIIIFSVYHRLLQLLRSSVGSEI